MDFKQLQYITKVAECQNITRAAEQLYVSQPALSNFISKTEEELGAKLFNRNTTPLTLTQAGEHYVKTARMILSLQENLLKDIDNLNNCREGVIKIGLSDMRATSLLPFVLPAFRRLYPNVQIKTVESGSMQVEEHVRNGVVDIGIIPLFHVSSEFASKALYQEELLIVSASELPAVSGTIRPCVRVEDLNDRDFVLLGEHTRIRQAIDTIFLEHNIKPHSILESSNHMTIYLLATTGLAIAIVPDATVQMMNPIHIPRIYGLGKSGFRWNIGAIWREDMALSSAHRQLLKLLQNR